MKSFRFLLLLILNIIFTSIAIAWNYTGHVLIAQIAYDNLSSQTKLKADQLSNSIYYQLPISLKTKIDFQYPNAVTFAKIAMLPDVWRNWKISSIYSKFGGHVPLNLLLYSSQRIASWHFIDKPYPADKSCLISNSNNEIWALKKLVYDLSIPYSDDTKAITMVLVEHLIGDIHQPLHTITNVSAGCLGDRGGNDMCLKQNAKGKCTKNLHSLWDSGVGYLKPHENIQALAHEIQQLYPASFFARRLLSSSTENWAAESYSYNAYIYRLAPMHKPSPDYYRNGQLISKEQLTLAGYRLAATLNKNL